MLLKIENVYSRVGEAEVLKGLSLNVDKGEVHIVMGPNGIGKSTLAHILMGNRNYTLTSGKIEIDGEDITQLSIADRARKGLFLGFQHPVSVPGLKISEYLRNLYNLTNNSQVGVAEFRKFLKDKLELLQIERSMLGRYLNDGLSGGEMKRLEMLQLAIVKPKIAILDEIDSGVDVDAQKIIAEAINTLAKTTGTSFIIISHYQRLPKLVNPDRVHIILNGKIARSGDFSLVTALEKEGYEWLRLADASAAAAL